MEQFEPIYIDIYAPTEIPNNPIVKLKEKCNSLKSKLFWDAKTHIREKVTLDKQVFVTKILPISNNEKPNSYTEVKDGNLKEETKSGDFNFTQVDKHETFFYKIHNSLNHNCEVFYHHFDKEKYPTDVDVDVIIRNAYPIVEYHMLYLPFYLEKKPQFIDSESIIIRVVDLVDYLYSNSNQIEDLIIGYNSKGACSSINNLHFQIFFLSECGICKNDLIFINENYLEIKHQLSLFQTEGDQLIYKNDIHYDLRDQVEIYYFENSGLLAFFKIIRKSDNQSEQSTQLYTRLIFKIVNELNNENIPYNILFFQNEVYLFPRKNQAEMKDVWMGINELLGQILLYTKDLFDTFDKDKYLETLRESKLSEECWSKLKNKIKF